MRHPGQGGQSDRARAPSPAGIRVRAPRRVACGASGGRSPARGRRRRARGNRDRASRGCRCLRGRAPGGRVDRLGQPSHRGGCTADRSCAALERVPSALLRPGALRPEPRPRPAAPARAAGIPRGFADDRHLPSWERLCRSRTASHRAKRGEPAQRVDGSSASGVSCAREGRCRLVDTPRSPPWLTFASSRAASLTAAQFQNPGTEVASTRFASASAATSTVASASRDLGRITRARGASSTARRTASAPERFATARCTRRPASPRSSTEATITRSFRSAPFVMAHGRRASDSGSTWHASLAAVGRLDVAAELQFDEGRDGLALLHALSLADVPWAKVGTRERSARTFRRSTSARFVAGRS